MFDIHFPAGMIFLQFVDDIMSESLIALHGDKSIAEEVKFSSIVITFNNPKWSCWYLTSLKEAIGSKMLLRYYSSVSRGSCPI